MSDPERCFACNRKLVRPESVFLADAMDGGRRQYEVDVGPECFAHVQRAGDEGYQPPTGGPRLYLTADSARAARLAAPSTRADNQTQTKD